MDAQKPPPLLMEPVSDNEIRDWLLHRLDPARAEQLEQRLLLDDELAPRLREAENDLLDDLAQGRLDTDERDAVRSHLLATPPDRQRLRIAAALARIEREGAQVAAPIAGAVTTRHTAIPVSPRVSARATRHLSATAMWGAGIAACLLLAVTAVVLVRRDSPPQGYPALAQLPSITLLASAQRGGGEDAIALPQQAERVRLQLEVDAPDAAPSTRYDVVIADADRILFSARILGLRTAGPYRFVEVAVPARDLGPGKRRITLTNPAMPKSATHWDIATR